MVWPDNAALEQPLNPQAYEEVDEEVEYEDKVQGKVQDYHQVKVPSATRFIVPLEREKASLFWCGCHQHTSVQCPSLIVQTDI